MSRYRPSLPDRFEPLFVFITRALAAIGLVSVILIIVLVAQVGRAHAEPCNISNLLFGKVRIENIQNDGYQTGIIFGDDFDSQRFKYGKILGQIASPERDGSRRITDINTDVCGVLGADMVIDLEEAQCDSCNKDPISLRRVGKSYLVMLKDGTVEGTIRGSLPK